MRDGVEVVDARGEVGPGDAGAESVICVWRGALGEGGEGKEGKEEEAWDMHCGKRMVCEVWELGGVIVLLYVLSSSLYSIAFHVLALPKQRGEVGRACGVAYGDLGMLPRRGELVGSRYGRS